MGIGIWFRVDPKLYEPTNYIDTDNFIIVGWIFIFGGFAIVITSLVGCVGAFTDSTWKLGFVSVSKTNS